MLRGGGAIPAREIRSTSGAIPVPPRSEVLATPFLRRHDRRSCCHPVDAAAVLSFSPPTFRPAEDAFAPEANSASAPPPERRPPVGPRRHRRPPSRPNTIAIGPPKEEMLF